MPRRRATKVGLAHTRRHWPCGQPLPRAYPFQGFVTTDRLRFWLHRPRWLCTLSHITDLRQRPSGGAVTAGAGAGTASAAARARAGPSVFDFPLSTRPGGVRGSGREGKTKNKKQRGPGPRMPTDLVQEGCNGRNGRNGPPTQLLDCRRGHPNLRWDSTTQSTRGFDGRRGHPDLKN